MKIEHVIEFACLLQAGPSRGIEVNGTLVFVLARIDFACSLQVGRSRGIEVDGTLAFVLARIAYSKIRKIWAPPLGYPPAATVDCHNERMQAYHEGKDGYSTGLGNEGADPALSKRLLKALAGRDLDFEIVGDGPEVASTWRTRTHSIYR
jgi:hypothetical protein